MTPLALSILYGLKDTRLSLIAPNVPFETLEYCLATPLRQSFLDDFEGIRQPFGLFEAGEAEHFGAAVLNELDEEHSDAEAFEHQGLPRAENPVLLCNVPSVIQVL